MSFCTAFTLCTRPPAAMFRYQIGKKYTKRNVFQQTRLRTFHDIVPLDRQAKRTYSKENIIKMSKHQHHHTFCVLYVYKVDRNVKT